MGSMSREEFYFGHSTSPRQAAREAQDFQGVQDAQQRQVLVYINSPSSCQFERKRSLLCIINSNSQAILPHSHLIPNHLDLHPSFPISHLEQQHESLPTVQLQPSKMKAVSTLGLAVAIGAHVAAGLENYAQWFTQCNGYRRPNYDDCTSLGPRPSPQPLFDPPPTQVRGSPEAKARSLY